MAEIPDPREEQQFEHDGKLVTGRRIEVVGRSEPTATFSLADGAVLSIRMLLVEVYKLDATGADGAPVYRYTSSIATQVWAPKHPRQGNDG